MYPMTTIEPIPMRFLWEARSVDYAIELTLNAMSFYQNKVGSDNLDKVMDNFTMAQSLATMASTHDLMPLCSAGGNGPYQRNVQNHSYPQLDTKVAYGQHDAKPAYAQNWSAPYGEDTPPIDNYSFDQSATYLQPPTTLAGSNIVSA
ncbi:hypothetical protein N0V91_007451 [Didymella pomorum]|uniref:Uncharacterized protein n=1 Tax=Didymella pomorum TaxID=749634 RepID=A0A9W8ZAU0_9PLEO|nr:hypothetical protein N0V91_007451 [Didymella pomorum]